MALREAKSKYMKENDLEGRKDVESPPINTEQPKREKGLKKRENTVRR
jgi:hypothetical protein